MRVEIVQTDKPTEEEIAAVVATLREASVKAWGDGDYKTFAFLLRDAETAPDEPGGVQGGVSGYALYGWMFVQFLAVPEQLRGQGYGARLLAQAEDWGRAEGLDGVWLDTFAFQAPEFYARQGYSVFGTIEDHPAGSRRLFLMKRFAD